MSTDDESKRLGRAYTMVHFDPATGAIKQAGFGHDFFDVPDCMCAELPDETNIHEIVGGRHRVDLASLKERGDGKPPLALIIKLDF